MRNSTGRTDDGPDNLDEARKQIEALDSHLQDCRQEAERLRVSEARLLEAQELANIGCWDYDLVADRLVWSDETFRIFGLDPSEFEATLNGFLDAVHPDDRGRVETAYSQSVETRAPYDIEHRVVRPGGEVRVVRENCRTFYDDEGKPLRSLGTIQDITEHKRQEEELEHHRRHIEDLIEVRTEELGRLNRALEASPVSVVVTDREGVIEYVNPRFTEATGYTAEEAVGRHTRILNAGIQPPEFYREMWNSLLAGDVWRGEFCNRSKDGTLFWESASISPVPGRDGEITHYVAVKEDITEKREAARALEEMNEKLRIEVESRKRAQDTLELNEERLEALLELGHMTEVSEQELMEHSLEEVVRLTRSEVGYLHLVNEDQKTVNLFLWSKGALKRCTATKDEHYPLEKAGIWADCARTGLPVVHNDIPNEPGRKGFPEGHFPVLRHMSVPVHDQGRLVAIAGVGNKKEPYDNADVRQLFLFISGMWGIVKRRRDEREQALRKALLEAQNEASLDGILTVAPDGTILTFNQRFVDMWGMPDEAIQTRAHQAVLEVELAQVKDPDWFTARLKYLRDHPEKKSLEELLLADGRVIDRFSAPVKGDDGTYYGRLNVFRDVTERKQVEEELRKARAMAEEASRAKSQFLANMSHEIRTPLNAITGMSHLLKKTDLTDRQRDYVDKMMAAARTLLGVISDILDLSKVEAGRLVLESVRFELDEVLHNVANVAGMLVQDKGLELILRTDPSVPLVLEGDPLRLGQVLTNLVSNAAKFTENGEIVVATNGLDEKDGRVTLHFSVMDTGIGLSAEQVERLFQPFTQADESTTRKYGGTGLGLSISRHLVELMGGEIRVDSEPGRGSTFSFTVVLKRLDTKTSTLLRVTRALDGMKVLVVDDNSTARDAIRDYLEMLHCRPTCASRGEEAIRELRDTRDDDGYRLALIDWDMPGMDGIETVRRIADDHRISEIPVVLMVPMLDDGSVLDQAVKAGIDVVLTKPVTRSSLLDTLHRVVEPGKPDRSVRPDSGLFSLKSRTAFTGRRVLLVEDNEINQQVAAELLEGAGMKVTVASAGNEALEALKASGQGFDVVLMDVQMPGMDGYETTRRIRGELGLGDVPVIAMTAEALAGDREKAIESGMNDHVTKPVEPAILFRTLSRWLGSGADADGPESEGDRTVSDSSDGNPGRAPAIDVDAGLRQVGGNRNLYKKILFKLRGEIEAGNFDIEDALDQDDTDALRRTAHTVKGVAGNVGAKVLQEAAGILEVAIRRDEGPDAIRDAAQRYITALGRVRGDLERKAAAEGEET